MPAAQLVHSGRPRHVPPIWVFGYETPGGTVSHVCSSLPLFGGPADDDPAAIPLASIFNTVLSEIWVELVSDQWVS